MTGPRIPETDGVSGTWGALERRQPAASPFDAMRQNRPDGSEFWSGRALCNAVEYETWRNFAAAIERAKIAASNSGSDAAAEFVQVTQLVDAGNLGAREREDYELSRHAAYLVLMSADPRKPKIAEAQAYFAVRTRQAEVIHQATLAAEDRAIKRLAVLRAAQGLIDPHHLEAKARIQLAIGLGEAPELEPATRPLYAQTYLEGRGMTRRQIKAISGMFGKRLKAAYVEAHGVPPKQYPLETSAGQIRNVNAYTESDRSLMDAVWDRFYAQAVI